MQDKEHGNSNSKMPSPKTRAPISSKIVTAETVEAEEVPTIPLESFEAINSLKPEVAVHPLAATRSVSLPVPLVVHPTEYRRSIGEWLQLWWDGLRPAYLSLSIAPVVVGSVLAWTQGMAQKTPLGQFHILPFVAALIAVVLIQLSAQLINDYYDYLHGIDTSNALGPGGLIQQALIRPATALTGALFLMAIGILLGAVAAISGGWIAFLFGLLGIVCAYFYSATSRSLASLTLGELVSFVVFGPLLTLGAYAVQAGSINRPAILYSLPLGLLAAAVVHANNMRDMESDAQAGKRTLATALSLRISRALYMLLLLAAYGIILALAVPHNAPHILLLVFWTLPIAVVAASGVLRTDSPTGFHLVMKQTLKLEGFFAFWLAIALIVNAVWLLIPNIPLLLR